MSSKVDNKKVNWSELVDDKNLEVRNETEEVTRKREIRHPVTGEVKEIEEKFLITKRIFPVRKCVKERKNMEKFGEVEKVKKNQHKQGDFAKEEVSIITPDSVDKNEINLISQIMKLNTLALKEKKEAAPKMEEVKEEKRGAEKLDKIFDEILSDRNITIRISNILLMDTENQEEEEKSFAEYLEKAIQSAKKDVKSRYQIKLINERNRRYNNYTNNKFKNDTNPSNFAKVFMYFTDQNYAQRCFDALKDVDYNGCILDISWAESQYKRNLRKKY